MRHPRPLATLPALLLLAVASAAPALADRERLVRDESKAFPLEGARVLRLDVGVGEVHVDATAGDRVEARLQLRCEHDSGRCRDRAARLALTATRGAGDELRLELGDEDHPHRNRHGMHYPEVELRLLVPATMDVAIDLGVGELELNGIEGDVTADLGVGEVSVEVPESAVRSVGIDVGIGEAQLSPRQYEMHHSGFLFLGNEVDWRDGEGRSRINVDIGVGEAHVRLVP